jgi:hypothetical protein
MESGESFRVVGERKPSRTVSWWWNRLYSPFTTLGHIASRVRAGKDDREGKQSVTIYDMAIPYEGAISDELSLRKSAVLEHASFADYRLGQIPFAWDNRCVMTMGVDLHGRWATWELDAWRFDEEGYLVDSWLVGLPGTITRYGQVGYEYPNHEAPNRIYAFLEQVVRSVAMEGMHDAAGKIIRPSMIAIDAGWQDDKKRKRVEPHDRQVYAFCRKYGQKNWRAVKGTPALDGMNPFEIKFQGSSGNKVIYTLLDRDILNTEVHEQEKVLPGGLGVRYIPRDTPDYYARCMCAEHREISLQKENKLASAWVRDDRENHLFDTRIYSWAAARMLNIKPPRPEGMGALEEA